MIDYPHCNINLLKTVQIRNLEENEGILYMTWEKIKLILQVGWLKCTNDNQLHDVCN